MKRQRSDGFTLIELLVVLSVLALLTTLAAPRLFAALNASKHSRAEKDLQTIQEALERHYLDRTHYPNKLGDLVTRGYLRSGTSFRSPVNGEWYFFAVDDNRPGSEAKAFILGQSGNDPTVAHHLHRSGPLPRGIKPANRAWGWYLYNSFGLMLYAENDVDFLPDPLTPTNLADYRHSCRPGSAVRCDLRSN